MGRVILVRAGTTDFDEQDRIAGTLDLPVNERGKSELEEVARQLGSLSLGAVYSAAGESAGESARRLGERLGVRVRVLAGLRNFDFGLWQGLQVAEVRRKYRKLFKQWQESPAAVCPPAGEMIPDVVGRVQKLLRRVLKRHAQDTIAIVAPEPLRKVVRCYLTQTPVANVVENGKGLLWEIIDLPPAGV